MILFSRFSENSSKIFLAVFSFVCISYSIDDSCFQFVTPKPGKIVTSPQCTLLLQSTCKDISKIELQARYFTPDCDTATIISLGTKKAPPFEFIWDLSNIPNQLFAGVAFLAEAIHKSGEIEDIKREGIFLAHQAVSFEKRPVNYEYSGTKHLTKDTINLLSDRKNLKIKSSIYWNEKNLTFFIDVEDPFFHSNISKEALSEVGLEILIDPSLSRKPYPGKDIIAFTIPLFGIPYSLSYKPAFDENGSFKMISSSIPCEFPYQVLKDDYKGYKIYFPIPKKAFGGVIPDSLSCNLILKVLNENNQIINVSWVKSGQYDSHSPLLFNTLYRTPKPILKNLLLFGAIAFIIGLSISLFSAFLIKRIKMPKVKKAIEKTEAEQKLFDSLKDAIDRQVTYKNLTIDIVARELHISTKKLNNLLKNLTGLTFHNFLMYARIEIAKERLRSSYCNESTIADACGFTDENEFMKFFVKFERTTPAKYRQKQQVT